MTPWLHIALAVGLYLIIAVAASLVVKRAGRNLADFSARTSSLVVAVGAIANLLVLAAVLALLVWLDGRPVSDLGLRFTARDLRLATLGGLGTVALGGAFVGWLRRRGRVELGPRPAATPAPGAASLPVTLLVLLIVVAQEEVLYRGYVMLALMPYGPGPVLLLSTAVFVAIHFATNHGDLAQTVSWTVGGLVLGGAYLVTRSLWVPIVLHFANNLANVVVFGIVGRFSMFSFSRPPSGRDRAVFRVIYGLAMLALIAAVY
jgi:CAAX protease family protein